MAQDDKKSPELIPSDLQFEPGFNLKTLWAALFVGFIMLPGAIYLGLVTGQSMAGGAEWVTLILFIEIAKRSFARLRTQEVIILYWVAGGLVMMGGKLGTGAELFGGPFGGLIWDQYLIQSPQADGLHHHIPDWVVPPRGSPALEGRSFLHPAWFKPIVPAADRHRDAEGQQPVLGLRALPHHQRHRAPAVPIGRSAGRRRNRSRRELGAEPRLAVGGL